MYNRNKFKRLVHYVCWRRSSDPSTLGSVKLNKSLWLSDLFSYYRLGHAITGVRYIKRQFGPVPRPILPVLAELQNEGVLEIKECPQCENPKKEYIVHKEATPDFLSSEELQIVEEIISFVCDGHATTSISDASYDHIWKAAEDGEEIPYFAVFAQPGEITDADREWTRTQLESKGA